MHARQLNPPRIVATWAVEAHWRAELAMVREVVAKLQDAARGAVDRITAEQVRIPWTHAARPASAEQRARTEALWAGRMQRYDDRCRSRLLPHVLR